jgi:hypothetical protein
MVKQYVYKNVHNRAINIGGYQFSKGQELESDILIPGFNEAVSNGFLKFIKQKPEPVDQNAPQALHTDSTGKVKVVFHTGLFEGPDKEIIEEAELDPSASATFPEVSAATAGFEGWFKDAEFSEPVNLDKAKAPRKGVVHFYAKIVTPPADAASNFNVGTGSANQ